MAEVVLVRWPEDGADGVRLVGEGVAVLYLVGAQDDPPRPTTCIEDWVRVPGDDRDLEARLAVLEMRAAIHEGPPRLDARGCVHYRGRALALSPDTARWAEVLIERFGDVVTDRELSVAVLGDALPASTARLQRQMAHLRARLREIDLAVRRVRRRGYLLQPR
jgi:DNA-binding response OmpR family regulator